MGDTVKSLAASEFGVLPGADKNSSTSHLFGRCRGHPRGLGCEHRGEGSPARSVLHVAAPLGGESSLLQGNGKMVQSPCLGILCPRGEGAGVLAGHLPRAVCSSPQEACELYGPHGMRPAALGVGTAAWCGLGKSPQAQTCKSRSLEMGQSLALNE